MTISSESPQQIPAIGGMHGNCGKIISTISQCHDRVATILGLQYIMRSVLHQSFHSNSTVVTMSFGQEE